MKSYNDHVSESSESDLDDEHLYKATTGYGKIAKAGQHVAHYSSSEEEDESPLSEDEDEEEEHVNNQNDPRRPTDKVGTIFQRGSDSQGSEVEEEENSIDHIEERIKRLEMDLEKKIDKHKKETAVVVKDRPQTAVEKGGKNLKIAASPPLPKKMEAKTGIVVKPHPELKVHKVEKLHEEKVEVEEYLPPTKKDFKHVEQLIDEQKQLKEPSPKKKIPKERREQDGKNPSIVVDKKRAQSKGNSKPDIVHPHPHYQQADANVMKKLNKATKQIDQLSRALEQTRKENKRLRQQLSSSKKKKSLQEVQKLKQLTAESGDVKLQKEIQLLKIIQGLQAKLKKSISKKLGKSRAGSTSAALLHKGLPSSLIH